MQLNIGQTNAVHSQTKQTLVLAGAGTGKTKVIIKRIENIINQGVLPSKIIVTTFTNKAATELKHRLSFEVGPKAFDILCGTFHRISAQLLKQYGNAIGLKDNFQILNEDDQKRLLKRLLKNNAMDTKLQNLIEKISHVKENMAPSPKDSVFKNLFHSYQNELIQNNYLDYSDLIMQTIFLFENNNEITKEIAEHILIDEYQDINKAQYQWIKLISHNKTLFCVGDEDQAIYSFRGSSIEYIQKFHHDFPNANIIKLEENYRSAKEILEGAINLIAKNTKQFEKRLIATNQEKEGKICINKVFNEYDEAKLIAKIITSYKEKKSDYSVGILVRTNMQIFAIEQELVLARLPYEIANNKKFYLRKEIYDLICYLKILIFPKDFIAFSRIINSPKRHVGPARLQMLLDAMKSLDSNFENALITMLPQLAKNAAEKCKLLLMQMQQWRTALETKSLTLDALLDKITTDIEYDKQEDFSLIQKKNIANLKEQLAKESNLEEFLENIQFSDNQEKSHNIQIMTMHAAKGLEFDIVVSPGWEENVFPSMLARDKKEIEEERRLAYVTMTRAKEYLEIIYATSRRINGQYKSQMPSRFLFDL